MSVFGENYANGYDALYTEKDYHRECNLIEHCLASRKSNHSLKILDVGCGTGGHAIELAQRGHTISGVDMSSEMVKIANQKAASLVEGIARPIFHVGDARNFELKDVATYDAAIMMFAVIGYLNKNEDIVAALSNIRKYLKPGSLFVCDFWWGPAVLTDRPGDRVRVVSTSTGRLLRATNTRLDTISNVAEVNFELFALDTNNPAKEFKETHKMRYFFGPELELLFKLSGFKLQKLGQFPDVDKQPTDFSWNATAVAAAI